MSDAKRNVDKDLVVGLGATGLSIARYLKRCDADAIFYDSRKEPPGLEALEEVWPDADVRLGKDTVPKSVKRVIASPGVPDSNPLLRKARKKKLEIVSDIELFARFVDKQLMGTLEIIVDSDFMRIPYTEAVDILSGSKKKFEFPVKYGLDLQSEHEWYLTEAHFKRPVIVYNYPKEIKPFYMRVNDDATVGAMDVLVPSIGEIIGGSQREERLDVLEQRMDETGVPHDSMDWYLDLRRFGSAPHAGFGLGFERFVQYITGMSNIRDVIPCPRAPQSIKF